MNEIIYQLREIEDERSEESSKGDGNLTYIWRSIDNDNVQGPHYQSHLVP